MNLIQNMLVLMGLRKESPQRNLISVGKRAVSEPSTIDELQKEIEQVRRNVTASIAQFPMKSPSTVQKFLQDNAVMVHDFLLMQLSRAIDNNLDEIILFGLGDSDLLLKLERNNYEALLNNIIEFYIRNEQYEKIGRCKKILEKHFVNRLIDESKN